MRQLYFLTFVVSLFFSTACIYSNTALNIDTEGDRSLSLSGSINPISGDYVEECVDHVIAGIEPIIIKRIYSSGIQKGQTPRWLLMPHTVLYIDKDLYYADDKKLKQNRITVSEPSGIALTYKNFVCEKGNKKDRHTFVPILGDQAKGITNNSKGFPSARTNLKNNRIYWERWNSTYTLHACDGSIRYYVRQKDKEFALLQKEQKPNGNWIFYHYEEGSQRLKEIYTTNPSQDKVYAKATFQEEPVPSLYHDPMRRRKSRSIHGSDGKVSHLIYEIHSYDKYSTSDCLIAVTRPSLPNVHYHYGMVDGDTETYFVSHRALGSQVTSMTNYYLEGSNQALGETFSLQKNDHAFNKVREFLKPVGPSGALVPVQTMMYFTGRYKSDFKTLKTNDAYTLSFDAYHQKTEYRIDESFRPLKVVTYEGDCARFIKEYAWSDQKEGSLLVEESIRDESDTLKHIKRYRYDAHGNVESETLYGNLTGHNFNPVDPKLAELSKKKNLLETLKERAENGSPLDKKKYETKLAKKKKCEENTRKRRKALNEKFGKNIPLETVKPTDLYRINYEYYDDRCRMLKKKTLPDGTSYEMEYLEGTDLLTKSFLIEKGVICHREFYTYNEDHVLISKVVDDGSSRSFHDLSNVTSRALTTYTLKKTAPALNYPEVVEEFYYDFKLSSYVPVSTKKLTYSTSCQVIKEELFSASKNECKTTHTTYDDSNRIIKVVDPIGRITTYKYDNLGKVIEQYSDLSGKKITYERDALGNTLSETTHYKDQKSETTYYEYDLKGRLTKVKDSHQNLTESTYDALDREVQKTLPLAPLENEAPNRAKIQTEYNYGGNPTRIQSPLGKVIQQTFNARGQVTSKTFPDHTTESFEYAKNGNLSSFKDVSGSTTHYTYDSQGRVIEQTVLSQDGAMQSKESFCFKGQNLIEYTAKDNVKTFYHYDGFGRKTEEFKKANDEVFDRVQYRYDDFGRLFQTIKMGQDAHCDQKIVTHVFDLADRIIEEREEDSLGTLYSKTRFSYDKRNNQIRVIAEKENEHRREYFEYDAKNRLCKTINGKNEATYIEYEEGLLNPQTQTFDTVKTTTNPKGMKQKERFSSTGLLLSKTLVGTFNQTLGEELYFYNAVGSKVKQVNKIYSQGTFLRESTTAWSYDVMGRVCRIAEAFGTSDEKNTYFTYEADGKRRSITNPDGTKTLFTYDQSRRVKEVQTSDRSVHYQFTYDNSDRVIEERDLVHQTLCTRVYDAKGNVLKETLGNGLEIQKAYDHFGRKTELTLPDHSQIIRGYDAYHLKSLSRKDSDGSCLYTHTYDAYDLDHQPLEETGALDAIKKSHLFDVLGKHIKTSSAFYTQVIDEVDACENVLSKTTMIHGNTTHQSFSYDELDHIQQESQDQSYLYDSQHNRIQKNGKPYSVNLLNQLEKEEDAQYSYDKNGNRIAKHGRNKAVEYQYDGLGRLFCISDDSMKVTFTYDALHRRLSKTVYKKTASNPFEIIYKERYLYDNQKEIGAFDEKGRMLNLRVIGLSKGGDISGAVAIEIGSKLLIPVHDLNGNIAALIDAKTRNIHESSQLTSFGEGHHFDSIPWGFQSKRYDTEFELVFFGRRYYDPKTGTWISPDPNGLDEGPSLYQYLAGNPLAHLDIWGLSLETTPATGKDAAEDFLGDSSILYGKNQPSLQDYARYFQYYSTTDKYKLKAEEEELTKKFKIKNPESCTLNSIGHQYNRHSKREFVFTNGIKNLYGEAHASASFVSNRLKHPVHFVHYKTRGLALDLANVATTNFSKQLIVSSMVENLFKTLLEQTNKDIVCFCHSLGCANVKRALQNLNETQRERIYVEAFGGTHYMERELGKKVTNYVSSGDLLSIGNNFGKGSILESFAICDTKEGQVHVNSCKIEVLKPVSRNPFKEHSFLGGTYSERVLSVCDKYKEDQ